MSTLDCPICMSVFVNPSIIGCGHTFCYDCINQWLATHHNCPECRTRAHKNQIRTNYRLALIEEELLRGPVISTTQLKDLRPFKQTPTTISRLCTYRGVQVLLKEYIQGNFEAVEHQYFIQKTLDFPSQLVRIFGLTRDPPGLLMDHRSHNVKNYLANHIGFSFHDCELIAADVSCALECLHSGGFVHGSVEPCNVLLNLKVVSSRRVIIGAKLGCMDYTIEEGHQQIVFSQETPSIQFKYKSIKASKKWDIFAFGVLIYSIYTNTDLDNSCYKSHTPSQCNRIRSMLDLNRIKHKELRTMVERMLSPGDDEQPTITEIKSFFNPEQSLVRFNYEMQTSGTQISFCGKFMTASPPIDIGNTFVAVEYPPTTRKLLLTLEKTPRLKQFSTEVGFCDPCSTEVIAGVRLGPYSCAIIRGASVVDELVAGFQHHETLILEFFANQVRITTNLGLWSFCLQILADKILGLVPRTAQSWRLDHSQENFANVSYGRPMFREVYGAKYLHLDSSRTIATWKMPQRKKPILIAVDNIHSVNWIRFTLMKRPSVLHTLICLVRDFTEEIICCVTLGSKGFEGQQRGAYPGPPLKKRDFIDVTINSNEVLFVCERYNWTHTFSLQEPFILSIGASTSTSWSVGVVE
ncbi:hypothetical protein RCL1_002528 [Eukaryota sp. TZLM3-RCL]